MHKHRTQITQCTFVTRKTHTHTPMHKHSNIRRHTLAGPNAQLYLTSIEFSQIEVKDCELKIKSTAN